MTANLRKAGAVFLTVSGLLGVILEVFSLSGTLRSAFIVALFATVAGVGGWLWWTTFTVRQKGRRALPAIESLDDLCTAYRVTAATRDDMEWIASLETEIYSAADAVPRQVLLEWYEANPSGFSVIRMPSNTKIGHIDLLPIRPATLQRFLDGVIVERDIRGDSLFRQGETDQIDSLYVESIILNPPKGYTSGPAILCLLTAFAELVSRVCPEEQVCSVYAIAASPAGEKLLRRLGFDVIKRGSFRKDGHDLFSVAYAELRSNITSLFSSRFPDVYGAAVRE